MGKKNKMSIDDKIDIVMILLGCIMLTIEYGQTTGFAVFFIAIALKREKKN